MNNFGSINFFSLLRTLRYLKFRQIYWKLKTSKKRKICISKNKVKMVKARKVNLNIVNRKSDNICYIFDEKRLIEKQGFNDHDKPVLWNYHLNYFDYIHNLNVEKGQELIHKWIDENKDRSKISWDPYPTSLRIVNWIKFLTKHNIENDVIFNSLYEQASVLNRRKEYHLLTNHLFKNIVATLFAGVLFNQSKWRKWGIKEFKKQLKEQLTIDNYHFELTPTYHAIFSKDLLDVYNLLKNNVDENSKIILEELDIIIPDVLAWCDYFSRDDKYLRINDVNYDGCPKTKELCEYAKLLGVSENLNIQQNIHYPIIRNNNLELMMYCAVHQPAYNPAHSHDDLSSILLWFDGKPILIDTGNYCYEESEERFYSRSTKAHNCFTVSGKNQSEMWKVFRIGRRAKITNKKINIDSISCSHNGYKRFGVQYSRTINIIENGFEIIDKFNLNKELVYEIYFHFHPDCSIELKDNAVIVNDQIEVTFSSKKCDIIETDYYPQMFRKVKKKTIVLQGPVHEKQHSTKITVIK